MSAVYFDPQSDDAERRARLYAGDLIILSPTPNTLALISLAKEMLESAFAPHDPRSVHTKYSAEQVASILSWLKPRFIHHQNCKSLISAVLADVGASLEETYFDVPRLRSAYPSYFLSSGIAYAFHPHRDTWYSAPMCQINWWIPVYPLDRNNSMAFYPQYFDRPVLNNSASYNYYDWNESSRGSAAKHVKSDTRQQPKPQEPLQGTNVRYLPPPGSIILFSGAQLHETVPNTTETARFSLDFRTVHLGDVLRHRGAVNVDSKSTGTTMRDYLRASDYVHLPEDAIKSYDDATSSADRVLYFGNRLTTPPDGLNL